MPAPDAADHARLIWLVAAGVAERFCGCDGACGLLFVVTAKCQSAPPLLSHVPEPLLNTQSSCVAFAATVVEYSHQFEAVLKVIVASGESTVAQLFQPRWIFTGLADARFLPVKIHLGWNN